MMHLSREELRKLLVVALSHSELHHAMILVAYLHGLRASEVIGLRKANIQDGFLSVQRLKGSDATVQRLEPSPDPLFDEKTIFEKLRSQAEDYLFPVRRRQTFWDLIQRYGKLAGIPEHLRHPHVLKHTVAMHSIKTAGIENVRKHLGHKSMSSTGAYLIVDDATASAAVFEAIK